MGKERLPQNINNLLMSIGEKAVTYHLYLIVQKDENKEWDVYQNLGESGCDVLLVNQKKDRQIKIEVKTRQRLFTSSKNKYFSFTITENEYKNMDFVICYWFEENRYFIIQKDLEESRKNDGKGYVLKETVSNNKKLYYVKVGLNKNNELVPEELQKYENEWRFIEEKMEKEI